MAIAGIPEITIGDTLADPDDPQPLPRITVDEPAISMTIGVNTSPLAGRGGGTKLTARLVKARLDNELVGNVSIRVLPTERPDTWEVQGRGELALAILVETMRREGFELTVGKPQVVTAEIDGKLCEPFERLTVDAPEEHLGALTQLLAGRKGQMEHMGGHGTGRVKLEYVVPARGLIGFRTEFLTETRGTGIANHVFEGYHPWVGEIRTRHSGSLVADRSGAVTAYAMMQLADRGTFFVEPGADAYEGMVVGENPRAEDLDVNVCREKKLTNMRSSTADVMETLARPRKLGLEEALEFCASDECVEVAPQVVRVRKLVLDSTAARPGPARPRPRPATAADTAPVVPWGTVSSPPRNRGRRSCVFGGRTGDAGCVGARWRRWLGRPGVVPGRREGRSLSWAGVPGAVCGRADTEVDGRLGEPADRHGGRVARGSGRLHGRSTRLRWWPRRRSHVTGPADRHRPGRRRRGRHRGRLQPARAGRPVGVTTGAGQLLLPSVFRTGRGRHPAAGPEPDGVGEGDQREPVHRGLPGARPTRPGRTARRWTPRTSSTCATR